MRPALAAALTIACFANLGVNGSLRAQQSKPLPFPEHLALTSPNSAASQFTVPNETVTVRSSSRIPTRHRVESPLVVTKAIDNEPVDEPVTHWTSTSKIQQTSATQTTELFEDLPAPPRELPQFSASQSHVESLDLPQQSSPARAPAFPDDLPELPERSALSPLSASASSTNRTARSESIETISHDFPALDLDIDSHPPELQLPMLPERNPFDSRTVLVSNDDSMIAPPPARELAPGPETLLPPSPQNDAPISALSYEDFNAQYATQSQQAYSASSEPEMSQGDWQFRTPSPCSEFEPFLTTNFRMGNRRVINGVGFMIPIWQDCESVLMTNLEGRVDDRKSGDGSFGLIYRQFISQNWLMGTYAYWDLKSTNSSNVFNQGNLGLEFLSTDWEFRVNGYFPGSNNKRADYAYGWSNGNVINYQYQERAFRGMDWEIGHRILNWGWNDQYEVRWYMGSYHFDHFSAGPKHYGGPRGRVEMKIHDLSWLGPQSRLEFGFEASADRQRNEQFFGFLRAHIPLGVSREVRGTIDPLRRRLLDTPIRPMY